MSSKINNKGFSVLKELNVQSAYSFNDFIFKDGAKRQIDVFKQTENEWLFQIGYSSDTNESYYKNIIKNYNDEDHVNWFKLKNPTLKEINDKLTNYSICKYHITCSQICDLDLIDSPNEDCPVCLKSFEKHYLILTKCKHYFCLPCLNSIVENNRKDCNTDDDTWYEIPCPLCRSNLTTLFD